jgi:hypothetical protein
VAIRWCLQLLGNAKVSDNELVDFEPTDSGAADRQPTNSESADGQRTNRDCGERQRPNRMRPSRLCPNADRWGMSEQRSASGPIFVDNACTAFTREHQRGLHRMAGLPTQAAWPNL